MRQLLIQLNTYTLRNVINTDYTLTMLEEENRYIVVSCGRYYSVNKFAYYLLYYLKEKHSLPEITASLARIFPNIDINSETVIKILSSEELNQILYSSESGKPAEIGNYIWFKLNIIDPEKITYGLKILSILFRKGIYKLLLLISCVLTLIIFLKLLFIHNTSYFDNSTLSAFNIVIVYLSSFVIYFIHEIGHATAAYTNKATSKSIGFGLYFIFPVFFTELTDIWRLPKSKRIQINLAGIYFQLLINVLLIVGLYTTSDLPVLVVLFLLNTISILVSLNPFFRFDGYWILSDLINIYNLRERSTNTIYSLLRFSHLRNLKSTLRESSIRPLIMYSVFNVLFWICTYCTVGNYLIISIKQLVILASTNNIGFSFIYKLISVLVIIIFLLKLLLKKQIWIPSNTIKKSHKL
jgi:putative peptide zinc metalloprotease protein